MDIKENQEKYIYKKSDFVRLGVPEGSFRSLMEKLKLNTTEYSERRINDNNRPVVYYTAEAYKKVAEHLQEKETGKKSNTSLVIINQLNQIKEENQNLKNLATIMESKYNKEIGNLKLEMKDMQLEHEKENSKKDKRILELEKDFERVQGNWKAVLDDRNRLAKELEKERNKGFLNKFKNLFKK